jgi:hypothetical protein
MSTAGRATVERLYAAFARLDGEAMAACYASDARFADEVFTLQGQAQVGGMWRMLCESVKSSDAARAAWRIEASNLTDRSAHWEAHYLFSATGRRVHNVIDAEFTFDAQGLIATHRDRFDFARWARQALGLPGWLLGWSPWLRRKVQTQAAGNLQRFLARG